MAKRASRTAGAIAPVTWRDGVHLTGTPIWCDARRKRDICFVSSLDGRPAGAQLIGTPATLALLAAKGTGHLAVPVRQRFTLGTVRLQLIPSGRGLGAAALHADIAGRTVMFAAAVRTVAGGLGDAAEVRSCDALVVDAPYGEVHHVFPPLERVIDEVDAWTRAELAAGRRPVVFADCLLDALEIACTLAARGVAVASARSVRELAARASRDAPLPGRAAEELKNIGKEPRAVVWLDSDHAGLRKAIGAHRFSTALASGRTVAVPQSGAGYDAAFAWACAADRAQLLTWIEATSARSVFVTGACAESIAGALGPRARVLGPPQQMALF